jgi:hypothetical protein
LPERRHVVRRGVDVFPAKSSMAAERQDAWNLALIRPPVERFR